MVKSIFRAGTNKKCNLHEFQRKAQNKVEKYTQKFINTITIFVGILKN